MTRFRHSWFARLIFERPCRPVVTRPRPTAPARRLCGERLEDRVNPTGILDAGFGTKLGTITTSLSTTNSAVNAVAVQADGKIVAVGDLYNGSNYDFAVARYNPDGSLDPTFGNNGTESWAYGPGDDIAWAVALQADGKIVVAGYMYTGTGSNYDMAVARLNPNGSFDTTFNSTRKQTIYFPRDHDVAYGVAVQADGKIVVAGYAYTGATTGFDFAVARLTSTGQLDTSFNSTGKRTIDFTANTDIAYGVTVQPDGKIILAGSAFDAYSSSSSNDIAVARLTATGGLDNTFNGGFESFHYYSATSDTFDDVAKAVAIQPDGKIVLAGYTSYPGNYNFSVIRLNSNGSIDPSFNGGGPTIDFAGKVDQATSLAIQPDGRIVVAGFATTADGVNQDIAVARLTSVGTLDPTFNGNGKETIDLDSNYDVARTVAVQADGRVVIAGYTN